MFDRANVSKYSLNINDNIWCLLSIRCDVHPEMYTLLIIY